ncbi:hypothetical protein M407DRAFT_216304 [Tulasnella calospora MUT 4182]|uniref:Uncharacterized protein n=1 Tax=Tulasnella calospora MUT 4182 TaxID=1051891 RepID=A0A0C3QBM0_9AGAM|nr:hypothetical protein M407DRAFT_216304 [Tulasnella calospora MUT 4182]
MPSKSATSKGSSGPTMASPTEVQAQIARHSDDTLPPDPEANQDTARQGAQAGLVASDPRPRYGKPRQYLDLSYRPKPQVRRYDPSSTTQQIGLLRVVNHEGETIPQYIWWDHFLQEDLIRQRAGNYTADWRRTTVNRDEALVVSFLPSSEPHTVACLNSRGGLKSLAIRFNHYPAREYVLPPP